MDRPLSSQACCHGNYNGEKNGKSKNGNYNGEKMENMETIMERKKETIMERKWTKWKTWKLKWKL